MTYFVTSHVQKFCEQLVSTMSLLAVLATDSHLVSVVYKTNLLSLLQETHVHMASAVVRMQHRQHWTYGSGSWEAIPTRHQQFVPLAMQSWTALT